ncbi:MAG: Na/Pi cotransporter family protein [Ruminococcaceae bacterium]|nr:Na/Pi cotransporter family protein [Oscillospiraceae bacterium]
MDIFNVLTMIGGLCLFLFGMDVMGKALERRAGNSLRTLLGRLTTKKSLGFITGLVVTAVIQSSSATTVMVVGFVNSGLLELSQAINVIMGANVGTTVTAWILSLSGIESGNLFVQLLKPTSFTPVLALIGVIFTLFSKNDKKKDTGMILLGFATLMFGMDTMSDAVSGLKNVPEFQQLFLLFTNPFLGVVAGAILTAVIQSSSASVGILQALASTGQVTYGAAVPIIMGQNIGTCVTAMLSSVGATKNARRAALVHLCFNIIGTVAWLLVFWLVDLIFKPALLAAGATGFGIAVAHSIFNVLCTALLLPMAGFLEKLVCRIVPDDKKPEVTKELDERLFATPNVALERSHRVAIEMAECAIGGLRDAMNAISNYTPELAEIIREKEDRTDHYEDELGSYLVRLSALRINESASAEAAMLLKVIGDFERLSDHSVNILCSVEEMIEKGQKFSGSAKTELNTLVTAVNEILDLAMRAFTEGDADAIYSVEPLEQVIDMLKEGMRTNHIRRLQQGECTIDVGFVWADLLTNFERVSDHCSNIAGCIIDLKAHDMNMHEHLRELKSDDEVFKQKVQQFREKYSLKALKA